MFGVFLGLIFIEQAKQPPGHFTHRIVRRLLGDGNELDAVLDQAPFVNAKLNDIPEEARQAMNDDSFKGGRFSHRVRNHLLKHRSLVIRGGGARLDVFVGDHVTVALAPVVDLLHLVGNGEIILRLADGADSGVKRN